MFKAYIFVIYCDPKDKDNRKKVLDAMVEARKHIPIKLESDQSGDYSIKKNQDILFVISSTPNLMFFHFDNDHKGPQGLVLPFGESIDTMKDYLPKLKTMDDLELSEWISKANNAEKEFAVAEGDDKNEANKKESLQRWFSL